MTDEQDGQTKLGLQIFEQVSAATLNRKRPDPKVQPLRDDVIKGKS
jgi:hypothetical protein